MIAGVTSNFLTDALGSPVAVTDNAGAVQTEYTYEAFGRTIATGAVNSSSYQYMGRENDGTGLYYYRARYYHPGLQRLISEDPIGFQGNDYNLYAYVRNNPLNSQDPSGQGPLGLFICVAAEFGNLASTMHSINELERELEEIRRQIQEIEKLYISEAEKFERIRALTAKAFQIAGQIERKEFKAGILAGVISIACGGLIHLL